MDYVQALVLAFVEGITEFLPISSTGHLILTSRLLNIPQTEFVKSFEIIIQLGAIAAIVFLYWQTLGKNIHVWKRILAAFLPTALFGLIFYNVIKHLFIGNTTITLVSLIVGGIILIIIELIHTEKKYHNASIEQMSLKNAFLIGIFQSLSMIPGVSRAGATIIGGLILGTKRKTAVEFSFLLAIPTMIAASGLDILKSGNAFTAKDAAMLAVGFTGAFVSALLVVKLFLRFIQSHTFIPFGIYRIIVAILYWLLILPKP